MDRGPIFIGGIDRSGKSFMRLMLAAHPNIAMTRRTNLWPRFYAQYGDLSRSENFERCLEAILRYKHVAFLQPDADRIRREFWQGPPTYARLFALLYEQYAEREGKPRWGDQTEPIERFADPIFAAYPEAKIIHLIRDPRDHYEAARTRWSNGNGKVGEAVARWLYSVGLAKRNQRKYPDRYKVVRYETMVSHPEDTLREVCAFLGEDYSPAVFMTPAGMGHKGPITTDYIGHYRGIITQREIAFIQVAAGRDMAAYGYILDLIRFSIGERLRFAVIDWPLNLARMLAWRTMETLKYRFLTPVRSEPASKMIFNTRESEQSKVSAS